MKSAMKPAKTRVTKHVLDFMKATHPKKHTVNYLPRLMLLLWDYPASSWALAASLPVEGWLAGTSAPIPCAALYSCRLLDAGNKLQASVQTIEKLHPM